jgi:hypothetical protein
VGALRESLSGKETNGLELKSDRAARLAQLIRIEYGCTESGRFEIWEYLRARGWRISLRRLRAAEGGLQAFVSPTQGSGFLLWVDDEPSPTERRRGEVGGLGEASPVARFRAAHELGHTHFFTGTPPQRKAPPSPAEETFCDQFAAALLVDPGALPSAAPT